VNRVQAADQQAVQTSRKFLVELGNVLNV